jgi:hypothetical protein
MADAPFINQINAKANAEWNRLTKANPGVPAAYKNAFFHTYSAAYVATYAGAGIAQSLGEAKEVNTWSRGDTGINGVVGYQNVLSERRDTWRDAYNNVIGIEIAEYFKADGLNTKFLGEAVLDSVFAGDAIWLDSDPRIPTDPGPVIVAGTLTGCEDTNRFRDHGNTPASRDARSKR